MLLSWPASIADSLKARFRRGLALAGLHKWAEAKADLVLVVAAEPTNAVAARALREAKAECRREDEAARKLFAFAFKETVVDTVTVATEDSRGGGGDDRNNDDGDDRTGVASVFAPEPSAASAAPTSAAPTVASGFLKPASKGAAASGEAVGAAAAPAKHTKAAAKQAPSVSKVKKGVLLYDDKPTPAPKPAMPRELRHFAAEGGKGKGGLRVDGSDAIIEVGWAAYAAACAVVRNSTRWGRFCALTIC